MEKENTSQGNDSKIVSFLKTFAIIQVFVFGCLIIRNIVIDGDEYCKSHGYNRHYPGSISKSIDRSIEHE